MRTGMRLERLAAPLEATPHCHAVTFVAYMAAIAATRTTDVLARSPSRLGLRTNPL